MNQMIERKMTRPHPHNKMWGKSETAHKSLGMTISVTGDTEPIRVCRTEGSSHYLILSGHSRFELCSDEMIECKDLGVLTEEQQVLRLIAYNAGHSTHPDKLVAAAIYCHKHFPLLPISSIMDAAGIVDNRDEWVVALGLSIRAVEGASPKNRKRTADSVAEAAAKGPKAIKETADRSLSKSGMKVAQNQKSSVEENAPKSLASKDLTAENAPNPTEDFSQPHAEQATQEVQSSTICEVASEIIPEISEPARPSGMPSDLEAAVKSLNRKMHKAGMYKNLQVEFSMRTLLAAAAGEELPEAPSKAVIAGLNKRVEEWMEVARTNTLEYEAAIQDINLTFENHMRNPVGGAVVVPAHSISLPFRSRGITSIKDMDPDVLAVNKTEEW